MNILVCIKQVPAPESVARIDDSGHWVRVEGTTKYWMNRFDEFAVEEALRIKSSIPAVRLDAITVGPDRAASVLERAMGMGADRAVHLRTDETDPAGPFVVASRIAAYARDRNYDLILCGVMAEDDLQGQVGPMVAELLGRPCVTSVIFEQVRPELASVYVEREIEGGWRDVLEVTLPALLTVQSGINTPRYPSLSNVLRAKKQKPETIAAAAMPPVSPRERMCGLAYPTKKRAGRRLEGAPRDKAATLLQILREKSLIPE